MKKNGIWLAAALLAACAQQPVSFVPQGELSEAQSGAKIHTDLGAGYYERGQLGIALEELGTALKFDSNYGPAHNMLGLVYMDLREDQLAQKSFEKAVALNPLDSDANNNYGWFLCNRQRERDSIKYFLAALKNPLYATPDKSYVNAGLCALRADNAKDAEEFFNKALVLRPNQPQALYSLAELAYKRSQYHEAKKYLTRYMQVANPSAASLWLGVRVERKLGDRNAENSYALQLRKKYPDAAETQALLSGKYE